MLTGSLKLVWAIFQALFIVSMPGLVWLPEALRLASTFFRDLCRLLAQTRGCALTAVLAMQGFL
jgi:hypothetical protein